MTIKEKIEALESITENLNQNITNVGNTVDSSSGTIIFKATITATNGVIIFDISSLDLDSVEDYSVSITTASDDVVPVSLRVIKDNNVRFGVKAIDLEYFAEDKIAYNAVSKGSLPVEGVITFNKMKVSE